MSVILHSAGVSGIVLIYLVVAIVIWRHVQRNVSDSNSDYESNGAFYAELLNMQ